MDYLQRNGNLKLAEAGSIGSMDANSPILVAEDDENDAFILKRALLQAGATRPIYFCTDGLHVQAYLRGEDPYADRERFKWPWVLLTDLKMPRMDGLDLLKWMHEHPKYHLIPIVVLTASRQSSDIEEAYRSGASSYLVKPSDFKSLVEMMKRFLGYWEICERPAALQPMLIE